jgi:hypothetical protein
MSCQGYKKGPALKRQAELLKKTLNQLLMRK